MSGRLGLCLLIVISSFVGGKGRVIGNVGSRIGRVEIRKGEPRDVTGIYKLVSGQNLGTGWSGVGLEQDIEAGSVVVARDSDQKDVVGMTVSWKIVDQLEIGNIFVAPSQRQRKIGENLVRHLIRRAQEDGLSRIILEVRESNIPARNLYEKLGFRIAGRRPKYYEGNETAILMECDTSINDDDSHHLQLQEGNNMLSRYSQGETPLVTALENIAPKIKASFFVPGHKMGQSIPSRLSSFGGPDGRISNLWRHDLTEIPGLDNLGNPQDVIAEAQNLASEAYSVDDTWFLVNGSTSGIIAAIVACVKRFTKKFGTARRAKVVLPRNVHKSAIEGLISSGAEPLWLYPHYDVLNDIHHGINVVEVAKMLEASEGQRDDIACILIVSPTYYGAVTDIGSLQKLARSHNIPLVVDEAHGAHLAFSSGEEKEKELNMRRLSATYHNADIIIQSTHKCLSALTQSAMLHRGKDSIVEASDIFRALSLVQTSSPSYLLMASLDAARWQMMNEEGQKMMREFLVLSRKLRRQIELIPQLQLISENMDGIFRLDFTRVTVLTSQIPATGNEVSAMLEEKGIYCEMSSERHFTLALSLGNTEKDIDELVRTLKDIIEELCSRTADLERQDAVKGLTDSISTVTRMTPREAFFAPSKLVPFDQAEGYIGAETISPYPPGIPILMPGEEITADVLGSLSSAITMGKQIVGATDSTLRHILVVDEK
mmetsp:Transcript_1966/g.2788  ORF Transcript_1966/g.2788 Transcript_1966/m.2788 type:complete len:714 (-) Transcript_1966:75-2216(-)